jgi:hypothetical protein
VLGPLFSEITKFVLRANWAIIESDNLREIKKVLHRHEKVTQANNIALLILSSKVEELEDSCENQNDNLLSLLLTQKHQIDSLEAKFGSL